MAYSYSGSANPGLTSFTAAANRKLVCLHTIAGGGDIHGLWVYVDAVTSCPVRPIIYAATNSTTVGSLLKVGPELTITATGWHFIPFDSTFHNASAGDTVFVGLHIGGAITLRHGDTVPVNVAVYGSTTDTYSDGTASAFGTQSTVDSTGWALGLVTWNTADLDSAIPAAEGRVRQFQANVVTDLSAEASEAQLYKLSASVAVTAPKKTGGNGGGSTSGNIGAGEKYATQVVMPEDGVIYSLLLESQQAKTVNTRMAIYADSAGVPGARLTADTGIKFVGTLGAETTGPAPSINLASAVDTTGGGIGGTIQPGDFLVAWATQFERTGNECVVSGGTGLTWTPQYSALASTNRCRVFTGWATQAGAGTVTMTVTGNTLDATAINIMVFRGVHRTSPLDVAIASTTGTGNNPNPPAITPVSVDCAIAVLTMSNQIDSSPGTASQVTAGYSPVFIYSGNDTNDAHVAGLVKTSGVTAGASNDPPAYTSFVTSNHAVVTMALRPAASSKTAVALGENVYALATPLAVTSGTPLWIALHADATIDWLLGSSTNGSYSNSDTFSDGISDPFGAGTALNTKAPLVALYYAGYQVGEGEGIITGPTGAGVGTFTGGEPDAHTGTGAGTVASPTGSGAGTRGQSGTGAGTVASPAGSASGAHGVAGTGAGTLAAPTGSGTGSHAAYVGQGAGELASPTGSANGAHGVAGQGAGQLSQVNGSASGAHGVSGQGAGSIAGPTGQGEGTASAPGTHLGSGAGTISPPTGAGSGTFTAPAVADAGGGSSPGFWVGPQPERVTLRDGTDTAKLSRAAQSEPAPDPVDKLVWEAGRPLASPETSVSATLERLRADPPEDQIRDRDPGPSDQQGAGREQGEDEDAFWLDLPPTVRVRGHGVLPVVTGRGVGRFIDRVRNDNDLLLMAA